MYHVKEGWNIDINEYEYWIMKKDSRDIVAFTSERVTANEIVTALNKQIAKEVEKHTDKVTTRYICPNCGRLYWEKSYISNYCDMCGQKLMIS